MDLSFRTARVRVSPTRVPLLAKARGGAARLRVHVAPPMRRAALVSAVGLRSVPRRLIPAASALHEYRLRDGIRRVGLARGG